MIERFIPCLLLKNGELYKTINFKNETYIGDPVNAVKIFSEKEADEIILLDIESTKSGKEPDFPLIESIANQAFMPVSYGGGVFNLEQMKKIFSIGIEKIILCSAAHTNKNLIREAAKKFGSQSVVVCLECKRPKKNSPVCVYYNGKKIVSVSVVDSAKEFESEGVS